MGKHLLKVDVQQIQAAANNVLAVAKSMAQSQDADLRFKGAQIERSARLIMAVIGDAPMVNDKHQRGEPKR